MISEQLTIWLLNLWVHIKHLNSFNVKINMNRDEVCTVIIKNSYIFTF